MFKTMKYCPQYPSEPFATIEAARIWVETFVKWYNDVHYHSAISFTTPNSRHEGLDSQILKSRS
ncbi:MAG: transposase [Chitinophagaceae bacterium]|nr:transposase [Oligoflexus sp.]